MSKVFTVIKNFFLYLYKLLDKFIITPISKIVYRISKLLNKNNGRIEKFLTRNNTLLYLSLILAVVFFLLIDSKVINFTETEAEVITNQSVKVQYNKEAYVNEDLPETVYIT